MIKCASLPRSAAPVVFCLALLINTAGCSLQATGPLAFLPLLLPPGVFESIDFVYADADRVVATRMNARDIIANYSFYTAVGASAPVDFEMYDVEVLELDPISLETRTLAGNIHAPSPLLKSDGRWIVWADWMAGGIVAREISADGGERRHLESAGNELSVFAVRNGIAAVQQGYVSYNGGPDGLNVSGPTFLHLVYLATGDVMRVDLPNEGIAAQAALTADRLAVLMHVPGPEDDLIPIYLNAPPGPFPPQVPPTYVRAYYGGVAVYDVKSRTWSTIDERISVDFARILMTTDYVVWSESSFTDTSVRPQVRAHRLSDGRTMTLLESNRDDGSYETMYLRSANDAGVLIQRDVTPPYSGSSPASLFPPPDALVKTYQYVFVGFDGAATLLAEFPETPAHPALFSTAAALTDDFAFVPDPTRGDFHAITLTTLEDRLFSMSALP
ncbi:MAG: hypothetical protein HUU22_14125 [Phycisphaerae bacterium]|nr:hypothetical protein [Phycisphaerae bacterium]NUQ47157.1 hypothetical protein [Phycisphaerae bacterium]